jgi:HAD superfamily hydrolase (TIGR01450 family)
MNRLTSVRHIALDMDGTIYSGGTVFESTLPFLGLLTKLGIGHTFMTNNSSKSSRQYLARLTQIGIHASPSELYTSTAATIEHLRAQMPSVRKLFVLGTQGLQEELAEGGFSITSDSDSDVPDAVVVGFDTALTFGPLCRAAWWIQKRKPFIATHPDRVCPTDEPTVLVDCGSICAALAAATGRAPDVVLGKPDPCMIRGILDRHSLIPENLAMVGDRLYTDMAMARAAGAIGVLVLTGETTAEQANAHTPAPDLIVENLRELGELLQQSHEPAPRGSTS